jgi:DNA sulfur modification protein DndD
MVKRTKQSVEDEANKIYDQVKKYRMINKKSELTLGINDNYGMHMISGKGAKLQPSAGGTQIVALSLVFALRNLLNTDGPIVLDTGIQKLDSKYSLALLDLLPKFGKQVVILALDTEIRPNSDEEKNIRPKIGESYMLEKDSDEVTYIRNA